MNLFSFSASQTLESARESPPVNIDAAPSFDSIFPFQQTANRRPRCHWPLFQASSTATCSQRPSAISVEFSTVLARKIKKMGFEDVRNLISFENVTAAGSETTVRRLIFTIAASKRWVIIHSPETGEFSYLR
jgi:hypothetical protein